tara:strand:+ start:383 stop:1852 length:1470 start_codon:yes stop_codon:yes gene_type:complete
MSKVFFHPDIDYQDIKKLEDQYNSKSKNYLAEKASIFISEELYKFIDNKKKVLFVCGPGFNGLDGIFVARNLYDKKYNVKILIIKDNLHKEYISKYNLSEIIIKNKIDFNDFDYIVDCIFGYGLNRNLDDSVLNLINSINLSSAYIISIDVPSGLDSLTGKLLPISINCNLLITLLTYKRGMFTYQGRDTWKTISYNRLITQNIYSDNYLLTANKELNDGFNNDIKILDYKSKHKYSSHKKSNGISCIIAGEYPYHGALIMSCSAAMKTGCKYLHAITQSEYAHTLPIIIPEIISTSFSVCNFEENITDYSNVLIGPGITSKGEEFVEIALDNLNVLNSLVIDAGGLIHLNKDKKYSDKLIITPHPGEAAKMLGVTVADIQADRYKSVIELYNLYNCIVILKGSGTIIYDGKNIYTCMDGNYKMSVAGMGDILSGILLSELSSPMNNLDACIKSVVYHSYACDYLLKYSKNKNIQPTSVPDIYSELTTL